MNDDPIVFMRLQDEEMYEEEEPQLDWRDWVVIVLVMPFVIVYEWCVRLWSRFR